MAETNWGAWGYRPTCHQRAGAPCFATCGSPHATASFTPPDRTATGNRLRHLAMFHPPL